MVRLIFGFILLTAGLTAFASTQDMINYYCGGKTPCYLCTDGSQIQRCINDKLCPIKKTACVYKCSKGTIQGDRCVVNPTQVTSTITCSSWNYAYAECPTSYLTLTNIWVITKYSKSACIKGFSYGIKGNKVWVNFGCRAKFGITAKTCPEGFKYVDGKCIKPADPACPLGNFPCIALDEGYYCSPYDCHNVVTTPTQITDTPMGINDKQNDAPVTDQGCLGNIYIFNGHDMRCRPPGVQTGFSDCCKKTSTWFGLGQCTQTEKELSTLRNWGRLDGSCHYVGEYCTEKWLGVCVQKKKTYCCYSSPLARIIVEAAHKQLGIPWGSPESPNCRGLTPEEFQKLDFSKVDFSEWVDYQLKTEVLPTINTSLSNAINDLKTTVQSSY